MKTNKTTIIAGLLLTALFAATTVNADSMKVSTQGLDLTTQQGAEQLYERIQAAARRVCNADTAPWDGQKIKSRDECVGLVVEDAVAQFNRPLLTSIHKARVERMASL